ncbi:DUF732 domain-containing protein [Streptomyces flavovirens]
MLPEPDADLRKDTGEKRRGITARGWSVVAGAAVLALLVTLALRTSDGASDDRDGRPGTRAAAPTAPGTSLSPTPADAGTSSGGPDSGPPYAAVPEFSSTAARDTAFVADVAQFSDWPSGTESYGAMSSAPEGSDISDFRRAVVRDARAVCEALADGTEMEGVPEAAGLPFDDPVGQAAFIVEAVTFYCPHRTAEVTDGVYTEPVPTEQDEDCPDASALEAAATVGERSDSDDGFHTAPYTVEVRNTSAYPVRLQLQQRWYADGYADSGAWGLFGDTTAEQAVTVEAGETFTYEGEQSGIYRWDRTQVRVRPGEFVFLGCGYRPGPGPSSGDPL